jgi:hypothetical protein
MRAERGWLALIFGLYFLLAAGYAVLLPQWEGPDEPAHYLLALNLARVGIFSSIENNYEAGQPQPYYRLASLPLKILYLRERASVEYYRPEPNYSNATWPLPIFPWADENFRAIPGLYALRALNILIGAGALLVNHAALRRLSGERRMLAAGALAFAALIPQYLHTAATVNNDMFGVLAGAFLFWLFSLHAQRAFGRLEAFLAALCALLLPFATKLTVLPFSAAFMLILLWGRLKQYGRLAAGLALAGALVFGAFSLAEPDSAILLLRSIGWRLFAYLPEALTAEYQARMARQLVGSFWGRAGWLAVPLPDWTLWTLSLLWLGGAGLSAYFLRRGAARGAARLGEAGAVKKMGLIGLASIAAVAKNALNTIFSQGRFLFPAVGALAYLGVGGWYALLGEKRGGWLVAAVVLVMLAANLVLWLEGVIPVYYQPFLD